LSTRTFRSFAKINLGLEVVGELPGGYHELKTIFATLSLHDTLEITPKRGGIVVRCDHPELKGGETNLAYRAAALMQRLAGRKASVAITIHKRIPVGGGLGGGSSNAATVLRALDLMWGLGLGPSGLWDAARSLGADVPYFLFGGPALGLARGDDIHPLSVRLNLAVLLVPGSGGVSTAAVFEEYDAGTSGKRRGSRIDAFLRAAERGGSMTPHVRSLRNDLEPAALAVSPSLQSISRTIHRVGRSEGAIHSSMSGSGSSFFLLFEDTDQRRPAVLKLRDLGIASLSCSLLSRSAYQGRFEI
jgi:4-diphosphocytidyl-2-C-methyl-D-erythritol kinase